MDDKQKTEGGILRWELIGHLRLASGELFIGDGLMAPFAPGIIVKLAPGNYEVWARLDGSDEGVYVAGVRVMPIGAEGELGIKIGTTWADTASQGFCDFKVFLEAARNTDRQSLYERLHGSMANGLFGSLTLDSGTEATIFMVRSGLGDGSFPVYEIVNEQGLVGVEVDFDSEDGL